MKRIEAGLMLIVIVLAAAGALEWVAKIFVNATAALATLAVGG